MAAPRTTVWALEPHTRAKHEILKRYLQAWMPILSRGNFPEIMYIDGFAGPGKYTGGEDGSRVLVEAARTKIHPADQALIDKVARGEKIDSVAQLRLEFVDHHGQERRPRRRHALADRPAAAQRYTE